MTAESIAEKLIKQYEGCRLSAYPDPATGGDPWTIGWGATGKDIRKGMIWTQEQADDRLAWDIAKFAREVKALLVPNPTAGELGALISFAYNVGAENLKSSTLLRKFNAGDKIGAAKEFPKWIYANKKVMKGLVRRREAEQKAFLS